MNVEAAKIIDRLLCLLQHDRNFNSVEDALEWLRQHASSDLWLSMATRDQMEIRDAE